MTQTKTPRKKRELKDLNFEYDGSHIALCHKEQGVANGADFPLVLKTRNFSDEFIEKMQKVRVELELPEFLSKFFGIYGTDAEVLARMMGYQPEMEDESEDEDEAEYAEPESYEDYIQSRLQAFELMKSAYESEDFTSVLSDLQEDEYLALLEDQELLEKAMKKMDDEKAEAKDKAEAKRKKPKLKTVRSYTEPGAVVAKAGKESTDVALAAEGDKPQIAGEVKDEATASVVKTKQKEKLMTTDVKVVEQVVETEVIEKAKFDEVQKAFGDMQIELQKAKEMVAAFQAEKKALIEKARKEKLQAAVKDEGRTEVFFKSLKDAEDEQFEAVLKALGEMTAIVDKSDLFQEQGATVNVEEPVIKESLVAKALKAKLQAAK